MNSIPILLYLNWRHLYPTNPICSDQADIHAGKNCVCGDQVGILGVENRLLHVADGYFGDKCPHLTSAEPYL